MDKTHENRVLLLENNELRKQLRAAQVERDVALDFLTGRVFDAYEINAKEPPTIKKEDIAMNDLMYPPTYTYRAYVTWKNGGGQPDKKYKIYIIEVDE